MARGNRAAITERTAAAAMCWNRNSFHGTANAFGQPARAAIRSRDAVAAWAVRKRGRGDSGILVRLRGCITREGRKREILAKPEAVLLDSGDDKNKALLYVFSPIKQSAETVNPDRVRKSKIVVFDEETQLLDGKYQRVMANSIRTAGYVELHNLREPRYDVLDGEVE